MSPINVVKVSICVLCIVFVLGFEFVLSTNQVLSLYLQVMGPVLGYPTLSG